MLDNNVTTLSLYYILKFTGHVNVGIIELSCFTISAQHDARVTQLDERGGALWRVALSGQQQVFSTYVSMNNVFLFLWETYMLDR